MSTQLDNFELRRENEYQLVRWIDVWKHGFDPLMANNDEGIRCTGGQKLGLTAEGHGAGIRVLCERDLKDEEVLRLLEWLAECVRARIKAGDKPTELPL